MKRRNVLFISTIIAIALCIWVVYEATPFWHEKQKVITVNEGQSLQDVAEQMHAESLIKNKTFFLLYGKLNDLDGQVKIGKHQVSSTQSVPELYKELVTAPLEKGIEVTFPEGFTIEQIAARLEKKGITTQAEFLKHAKTGEGIKHPLIQKLKNEKDIKYKLEGYLFPDTYYFKEGISPGEVIERMLDRFEQVHKELDPDSKHDLMQWVTLASIVEKEAVVEKERELIARVFQNRMKDGWKLQSCATVQYVLDKPKERLLYKDLEVDSPYNTYTNEGLPPGPIGNPGKQSLEASLKPKDHDYYFFVVKADGSGEHHFSKTFREHQQHTDHKGNW
ncbi:endolytic transglycosylase MltG [Alkalihalobacillus sp. TS-13]|uniref:endolytic transglycosylase MltG n=1 Tax=Alkalihalobacillus sp. TS-13 TaxID=2842455 RepID=UPI001C86A46F|nr:endolytic transglycosylase MltG [Alkalihalobacillus sp. TS-13]